MSSSYSRLAGLALVLLGMNACGAKQESITTAATPPVASLQSTVLKQGDGPAITAGQIATVQYTGWLYEMAAKDNKGKRFDSSFDARKPFSFPVGAGSVIKGWDQGVLGMKVGESRRLVIPPDLGYGDAGAGGVIPPGATLVFDIDLVKIE